MWWELAIACWVFGGLGWVAFNVWREYRKEQAWRK